MVVNLISCDDNLNTIYKHDGISSSILDSFNAPTSNYPGVWGLTFDGTNLISCDYSGSKIYKHNGFSSSILDSFSSPGLQPTGLAFDGTNLISCNDTVSKIYKHDGISSSILDSFSSPSSIPTGLTAISSTFILSGTISDEFGNAIRDADITISNGTTYITTTDENGAYSQVVNVDTYDIAVSKSRSTYHDITVSSVAVAADTTQDITMLLDKVVGGQNARGISIPGGISMGRSHRSRR